MLSISRQGMTRNLIGFGGGAHYVRRRGFTMVELLIIVVIAALIMTIAVPSYQSYLQRAKNSTASTPT